MGPNHEHAEEIQRVAGTIDDMMEQASSPTCTNGFLQRTGRKWPDIQENFRNESQTISDETINVEAERLFNPIVCQPL
jgi:hypothetical protein